MIELLHCDCMEYMATVPDKYFDLAIVDPPYGIGAHKEMGLGDSRNGNRKASKWVGGAWDNEKPSDEYFNELFRISKNQIIWGGNYFDLPPSKCWIIWDKNNSGDFADCELAWTSFDTAVRKFKYTWNGMLQQDMKNKEVRIHPNHKPIALYSWIYMNYLPNGGKVFDGYLGSGSNRIAAHKAGNIDFTAYELDKDYFEAQEKRYKQFADQTVLF